MVELNMESRSTLGVVVYLVRGDDGVRIRLEDVRSTGDGHFDAVRLFTEFECPGARLEPQDLTDEQLTMIGNALVARLAALENSTGPGAGGKGKKTSG